MCKPTVLLSNLEGVSTMKKVLTKEKRLAIKARFVLDLTFFFASLLSLGSDPPTVHLPRCGALVH